MNERNSTWPPDEPEKAPKVKPKNYKRKDFLKDLAKVTKPKPPDPTD